MVQNLQPITGYDDVSKLFSSRTKKPIQANKQTKKLMSNLKIKKNLGVIIHHIEQCYNKHTFASDAIKTP